MKTFFQNNIVIQHSFYCPHNRNLDCNCKKPALGMIEQCMTNYDVDLKNSFFIGDSEVDVLLGKSVGMKTIAVRQYFGTEAPDFYAENLLEAIEYVGGKLP